jgi:hypothetical protein
LISMAAGWQQDGGRTGRSRAGETGRERQLGIRPGLCAFFQDLLPAVIRGLSPDHPDTLTTRANIAGWTGESGDPVGALRVLQRLLPDLIRGLGPDHPVTVTARNDICSVEPRRRSRAFVLGLLAALPRVRTAGRLPSTPGMPLRMRRSICWRGRGGTPTACVMTRAASSSGI